MKIIKVQNQDNLPDYIRHFELTKSQYQAVVDQIQAGKEVIEVPRPNGNGISMSFPARFYKGLAMQTLYPPEHPK